MYMTELLLILFMTCEYSYWMKGKVQMSCDSFKQLMSKIFSLQ